MHYDFQSKKVVIVAGTNGKGSTSRFLGHLLYNAGKSVGVYTNPEMNIYNDQFWMNGKQVDLRKCIDVSDSVSALYNLEQHSHNILVALSLFSSAEYIVLEVGAGGKNDPVNLIEPDVSIITSISLDHCYFLGKTVEEIGLNKAHVFRSGKPALIAGDIPRSVLRYANDIGAVLVDNPMHDVGYTPFPHQNASLAIEAVARLNVCLSKEDITRAINNFDSLGYFDIYDYKGSTIVVDHAHNIGGVEYFVDRIKSEITLTGKVYVMSPFNKSKKESHAKMFSKLNEIADEWIAVDMGVLRLFSHKETALYLKNNKKPLLYFKSLSDVFCNLDIKNGDVLVVCGNLILPVEINNIVKHYEFEKEVKDLYGNGWIA